MVVVQREEQTPPLPPLWYPVLSNIICKRAPRRREAAHINLPLWGRGTTVVVDEVVILDEIPSVGKL